MKNFTLICVAFVLSFTGCTLEKRHYRNGFYTNFHTRTIEKARGIASPKTQVERYLVGDTIDASTTSDLVTDTIAVDTQMVGQSVHTTQYVNEKIIPGDTLTSQRIDSSEISEPYPEAGKNPIWKVLLGIAIVALFIALVGWLMFEAILLVILGLGVTFLIEIISATLVVVRTIKKGANESTEVKIIKKWSLTLAIAALVLLIGFIFVAPLAEIVGFLLAALSVILMFGAGVYSYRLGKAASSAKSEEINKEKSNQSYLPAMIAGYASTLLVVLGIILFVWDVAVFFSILCLVLALILGIYTIVRFAHYKKHRAEIVDADGKGANRGGWMGLALFFAILGLVLDLLIGGLGLFLVWALGGF